MNQNSSHAGRVRHNLIDDPLEFPDEWEKNVRDFEREWLAGNSPALAEFLPDELIARQAVLRELALTDLEFRLKRKDAARVEDYLEQFPELGRDRSLVGQLIRTEFQLRRRFEPLLSLSEYQRRFPDWNESLSTLLNSADDGQSTQIYVARSGDRPQLGAQQASEIGCTDWSDFEIRDELGRGGMGVVHLAWQRSLERLVAIKTLHPFVVRSDDLFQRFRQEAISAAQLHHLHIVRVMAYGEVSETPFYVMEYVSGGNLAQQLAGKPWSARESARLIEMLARAAHFAHQRNILHRDLKPSNILIAADGSPTISDFGLAKRLDQTADHTSLGILLGTPSYMSPEQASGPSTALTAATDIYSLGAILYELLTGRPPVGGDNSVGTLEMLRTTDPTAPRQLVAQIPKDLETICLKCLRRSPVDRYSSAEELANDLQRFLDGRLIQAKRPTSWSKLRLWCRRQPLLVSLSATVVVLLAMLGAWLPDVRSSGQKTLEAQKRLTDTRQHFHEAHNAVRAMFGEVATKSELIRSRKFYTGFLEQHTNDSALQIECAISQFALGKICEREKDLDAAIEWWRAADHSFDQLETTVLCAHDEALRWCLTTQMELADELCRRKDHQAALQCYEKAQMRLVQRLRDQPDNVTWQHRLAYCQTNQCRLAGNALKADEALIRCEAAAETWRSLVASKTPFPTLLQQQKDSFHGHLAIGLRNCGKVLLIMERYSEAIERFQEVLHLDEYRRQHPEELGLTETPEPLEKAWAERVHDAHDGIAKSHYMWGKRRLNDSQPDLSVANFQESIQHWTIVVESGLATSSQRWYLGSSHFHLAIAHRRQGHFAEALTEYQIATAHWEPMLADQKLNGFNRDLTESHLRESYVEIKKIQDSPK